MNAEFNLLILVKNVQFFSNKSSFMCWIGCDVGLTVRVRVRALTLVGWMSGRGSRDSGISTTRTSFLAFHSFLNRSILAAASSLMDDPELWVGHVGRQKQV